MVHDRANGGPEHTGDSRQERLTRHNVEGALLVGIALILYLAHVLIPVFGGPLVILCPLPLMVLALRHPLKVVIIGNMVATILAGILTGQPILLITFLLVFSLPAATMGLALRAGLSAKAVILLGGAVMVVGSVALLGITVITMDETYSLHSMKSIFMNGVEKQKVTLAEQIQKQGIELGWSDKKIATLIEGNITVLEKTGNLLWKALPAALIMSFFIQALLNYLVAGAVLKRLGYSLPRLGKFLDFKLPWYAIWLLIGTIVFFLAGRKFDLVWMDTIGLNLQVVSTFLFFAHGLAIVLFFTERLRKNSGVMRFPFYIILASVFFILKRLAALAFMLIAFLGIYDLYFDFRTRAGAAPADSAGPDAT